MNLYCSTDTTEIPSDVDAVWAWRNHDHFIHLCSLAGFFFKLVAKLQNSFQFVTFWYHAMPQLVANDFIIHS